MKLLQFPRHFFFPFPILSVFSHLIFHISCQRLCTYLPILADAFQVLQFVESQEYSMFTRIVFDTAPTVSDNSLVYEAAFLSIFSAIFIKLPIGSYASASFAA